MFNIHAAAALAAAAGSPAPKKPGAAARGRYVSGTNIVYDVDKLQAGEAPTELAVQPITVMKTDYTLEQTRLIAVNNTYIIYGLKTGAMRVLHKHHGSRALFKSHTAGLTDVAFYSYDQQLLASVSRTGDLAVQEVLQPGGDVEQSPEASLYLRSQLPPGPGLPLLAWHPATPQILAAAASNTLHLYEVPSEAPAGDPGAAEPGMVITLPTPGTHITSLTFSPSGRLLAAGDSAGGVTIWHLEDDTNPDLPAEAPRVTFTPHGGSPVPTLHFLHQPDAAADDCVLLTGDATSSSLALWSLRCPQGAAWPAPSCSQRMGFSSSKGTAEFFNHVALVPGQQLILAANSKRREVYTLHYAVHNQQPWATVDYLATFSVAHLMLSIAPAVEPSESSDAAANGSGSQLSIYTVQTEAIQQYTLDAALCELPEGAAESAAESAASEAEAAVSTPLRAVAPGVPSISPSSFLSQKSQAAASPPAAAAATVAAAGSLSRPRADSPGQSPLQKQQPQAANGVSYSSRSSPAAGGAAAAAAPSSTSSSSAASSMQPPAMPPMPSSMLSKSASLQQEDHKPPVAELKGHAIDAHADSDSELHQDPAAAAAAASQDSSSLAAAAAVGASIAAPAAAAGPAAAVVAVGGELEAVRQQLARLAVAQEALLAQVTAGQAAVKADVEGVLGSALKTQEAAISRQVEALLKASRLKEGEERRKASTRDKQDLEKSFNAALRTNNGVLLSELAQAGLQQAKAAMQGVLAEALPPVTSAVTSSVAGVLQQSLSAALAAELGAAAAPLAAAVERALAPQLAAAVARPLQEGLTTSFQGTVLPGFERATQVMFSQIEQAFSAWLADSSSRLGASTSEVAAPLSGAVSSLQGLVGSLRAEVLEGQRQLTRLASSSASSAAAQQLRVGGGEGGGKPLSVAELEAQALDPKVQISKLLAGRQYEEAFITALNTSSLDTLMWAARQVDASVLSSGAGGTPVLSQMVLLSLLHQLSSELRSDAALKLEWLAEVVPLLNARDSVIAPHVHGVAGAAVAALKGLISGLPSSDPLAKQAKPVLHLLNSLLMAK